MRSRSEKIKITMKEITVGSNEAGQRLTKLLEKVLNQAPRSFLYKMLRKKNIKLNDKRADGGEILQPGDRVQIYLSDETYEKFHLDRHSELYDPVNSGYLENLQSLFPDRILYQDDNIMIINKPAGILSQKARPEDDSINERLIRYLLRQGLFTEEQLQTFTPSVCNRLDQNTSGILLAGISLAGSQELSRMLRERSLEKYYLTLVVGTMKEPVEAVAYLKKDKTENRVQVSGHLTQDASRIETHYRPLKWNEEYTLLEVKLITGKSHQIRAHLAYLGHPVLGDARYGSREQNLEFRRRFGIQNQFLHAYRVVFPVMKEPLSAVSGMECRAPLPGKYREALRQLWGGDWMERIGQEQTQLNG